MQSGELNCVFSDLIWPEMFDNETEITQPEPLSEQYMNPLKTGSFGTEESILARRVGFLFFSKLTLVKKNNFLGSVNSTADILKKAHIVTSSCNSGDNIHKDSRERVESDTKAKILTEEKIYTEIQKTSSNKHEAQKFIANNTCPIKQERMGPKTNMIKELSLCKSEKNYSKSSLGNDLGKITQSSQWQYQKSINWWSQRYHKREREGGRGDKQDHPQDKNDDSKKNRSVDKILAMGSVNGHSVPFSHTQSDSKRVIKKPVLEPPKVGVFALYYILTKIGIISDAMSNFSNRKEIELVDSESSEAHKKRLEELRNALNKESSAARWGVAAKVFSWIASLMGIVSGIALIATGVGALTGAILITGGVIQITNQILEMTGGWNKIAESLPGNDSAQKRAIITWMQIGIAVLCLVLSAVGVFLGGFADFGQAMQTATALFGGAVTIGQGVSNIGLGVATFMFKNKLSQETLYEKILAELKHKRQDMMESVESGIDRLEQLFEDLAKTLEFETELFQTDQILFG